MRGSEQLCLFKFPRPLLEKFGREFFKNIPVEPGVYVFHGPNNRVLYVGQSHNLKLRLAYYKNAQPEREPRRIVRLVHETDHISWTTCLSAEEARLLEIEAIRELRPKFNRALASVPSYLFFGLSCQDSRIRIRLLPRVEAGGGETWIGAFKNHGLCRQTLMALGRALWFANQPIGTIYDFPFELSATRRHFQCTLPRLDAEWLHQITSFIRGESCELSGLLRSKVDTIRDPILNQFLLNDCNVLDTFFELAVRMKKARQFAGNPQLLEPERIDSALLKIRMERKTSEMAKKIEI